MGVIPDASAFRCVCGGSNPVAEFVYYAGVAMMAP